MLIHFNPPIITILQFSLSHFILCSEPLPLYDPYIIRFMFPKKNMSHIVNTETYTL